jgi:hypothetical protein
LNPLGNQAPGSMDNGSPQQMARSMPDTQQNNAPTAHQTTQEAQRLN